MKNLEFKISISASKETVWDALVDLEIYKVWAEAIRLLKELCET
jgi:hypothetical protein